MDIALPVKHCALQTKKKPTHVSGCAALPCSLASAREKGDLGKNVHVSLVGSSSSERLC